jgi:hypothetical protein
MNRAEYWLLSSAVETPQTALEWLPARRATHGLAAAALANLVQSLFERGDLVAQPMRMQPRPTLHGDAFVPTLAQTRAALAGELHLAYALTPRGGARWERHARPDWRRYVARTLDIEAQQGSLASTSRDLLYEHLEHMQRTQAGLLLAGSEQWETLMPWEATYWKVLPVAHCVCFRLNMRRFPAEAAPWPALPVPWQRPTESSRLL